MVARPPKASAEARKRRHEPDWEPEILGRRRVLNSWDEYMAMAKRIIERFDHQFDLSTSITTTRCACSAARSVSASPIP